MSGAPDRSKVTGVNEFKAKESLAEDMAGERGIDDFVFCPYDYARQ
jgi:hypothetical protein